LYVLLTGMPPFDADIGTHSIDFPDFVPELARDLIRQLLQSDPRQRATVITACAHPWVVTDDGDTHVYPLDDPLILQEGASLTPHSTCTYEPPSDGALSTLTKDDSHVSVCEATANYSTDKLDSTADVSKDNGASSTVMLIHDGPCKDTHSANDSGAPTNDSSLKPCNRSSKVRLSATNFSFRRQSPGKRKLDGDTAHHGSAKRRGRSLNSGTPLPAESFVANVKAASPKLGMFEPSKLCHSSERKSVEPSSNAQTLTSAKTLRTINTKAVTPTAFTTPLSDVGYDETIDRDSSLIVSGHNELAVDDVVSVFTENTESVSSFSTIPAGPDESSNRVSLPEAPADLQKSVACGNGNATTKRKRTRATVANKQTKSSKAKASRTATPSDIKKKPAGGKQTTLNKWFRK
jgi:serine/threonine protein kinase